MKLYEKENELMKLGYFELNKSRGVVTLVNKDLDIIVIKSKKGIFTELGKGIVGQETKDRLKALKDNLDYGHSFNYSMACIHF